MGNVTHRGLNKNNNNRVAIIPSLYIRGLATGWGKKCNLMKEKEGKQARITKKHNSRRHFFTPEVLGNFRRFTSVDKKDA